MKRVGIFLVIAVAVFASLASMEGQAATYKYTDRDGNVGLADDLQTIPREYRSSAVLIGGDAKQEAAPSPAPAVPSGPVTSVQPPSPLASVPPPAAPPAPAVQPPVLFLGMPFSTRLAISFGVIIAASLLSALLGMVSSLRVREGALHNLRTALAWIAILFVTAAHTKDVLILLKITGQHVQSVSEESAKQGEKAAKAIKSLDAAMEQAAKQAQENTQAVREAEREAEK